MTKTEKETLSRELDHFKEEVTSKLKHWPQLSGKVAESYRQMYANLSKCFKL